MTTRTLLASLTLAALFPALPGAGCRAHHAARITADVSGAAVNVIVLYFRRDSDCGPTGAECLDRPELWESLAQCTATPTEARADLVRVSGCTRYVGVDYAIDIIAVEDRDGNGQLDPHERYGMWLDGPLYRDREKKVGVIHIAIDQTLASSAPRP